MSFIDSVGSLGSTLSLNSSEAPQAAQKGSLGSLSISVAPADHDALSDSLEELGFAKDNSKQMRLADRKQKSQASLQEEMLKKLQRIHEMLNASAQAEQHELIRRHLAQHGSRQDFLRQLSDQGSSASSAAAALAQALEQAQGEDKKELEACLQQLLTDHKGEILACTNALDVLEDTSYATAYDLSQTYSSIAENTKTATAVLSQLKQSYGIDHLEDGIQHMFKALAHDLACAQASHEEIVLQDVASTLSRTQELCSGFKLNAHFISAVEAQLGVTLSLSPGLLLDRELALSQNTFVSAHAIHDLYKSEIPTADPEQDVLVAQEFLRTLRQTSPDLFDNDEQRTKLMSASQLLVDDLVDAEDEWLASMEE